MEWLSSLLACVCPYCEKKPAHCSGACEDCSLELARIEAIGPVGSIASDVLPAGIPVFAAGTYDGFLRELILRNKKALRRSTISWMAKTMNGTIPAHLGNTPLAWVPGRPMGSAHLVEVLALEFHRLGHPIVPRALLRRQLNIGSSQKTLSRRERLERSQTKLYKATRTTHGRPREVLLLDDVVTTGGTLAGCIDILAKELGVKVLGCVVVARTPSAISARRRPSVSR